MNLKINESGKTKYLCFRSEYYTRRILHNITTLALLLIYYNIYIDTSQYVCHCVFFSYNKYISVLGYIRLG